VKTEGNIWDLLLYPVAA